MNPADLLSYDPETGLLTWKVSRGRVRAGTIAGNFSHSRGYVGIRINGRRHYAHRLAWEIYHGTPPSQTIDHINGKTSDNRITNLRDVSQRANNSARFDRTLPTGVHLTKSGRYQAICKTGSTSTALGTYDTPEQAHQAYLNAIR